MKTIVRRSFLAPELCRRSFVLFSVRDVPHAVFILHSFVGFAAVFFLFAGASIVRLNAGAVLGN